MSNKDYNVEVNRFIMKGKFKENCTNLINPEVGGLRFIVNFCSNDFNYGEDVSQLINKRWPNVRRDIKELASVPAKFKLGELKDLSVQGDTWVINCFVKDKDKGLDEAAVDSCLKKLLALVKLEKATVHVHSSNVNEVPGLKDKLNKVFCDNGFNVSIYV